MPHTLKLSEIKTNITTIIQNLQQLETVGSSQNNNFNADESATLQQQTTALLSSLEELPAKQIARLQLQRKRRRQQIKQKCKKQKRVNRAYARHFKDTKVIAQSLSNEAQPSQTTTKTAQHITLKKLHDANNKIKTFDLLERLYNARGGEKDLNQRLSRMRAVWRRVKQECENATGGETSLNLEAQWNQVIFGNSCTAFEHRRSQKKQHLQQLIQCRFVWDSYISNGSDATFIPSGWVLPPENPSPEWAEFLCE
ncbi:uncharacterized protein LOC127566043 [Drosophila albomicans]|uniref:Uncharacterized protein LOC127566043 n=1 Tax=Drosophila albomicans TaxID=7291 RepID=A0A9C6TBG9_DROAB|nr:uncharacterized protein LOC127566043 [Drosophila albomicans]